MKLTKLWAGALALFALTACNKEQDVVTNHEQPTTKSVYIQMTTERSVDDLRVAYGIGSDGKTTGLQMSDKNLFLRVAVRRSGAETAVNDLEFKKITGNRAIYSGKINIPTGGTGDYQISAVLLGEKDGKTYGTTLSEEDIAANSLNRGAVDFANTGLLVPEEQILDVNLPYMSEWQKIKISGDQAEASSLYLKPFGTLLRMKIKNSHTASVEFKGIQFVMNSFSPNLSINVLKERGSLPDWALGSTERYNLALASPITLESNQESSFYYTVVYPREGIANPIASAALVFTGGRTKVFESKVIPSHGHLPLTLIYKGATHDVTWGDLIERDEWGTETTIPKLAIEYVADEDLNASGDGFTTAYDQVGRFTPSELAALGASLPVGSDYHIPTRGELLSIFPPRADQLAGFWMSNRVTRLNHYEEGVTIGGITRNYLSDYIRRDREEATPLYGLRFKDTRNCTAYRYRTITDGSGNKSVSVDCIYVGAEALNIRNVADESFWTTRASQIKSKVFPMYGVSYTRNPAAIEKIGEEVFYLSSTPVDLTASYMAQVGTSFGCVTLKTNETKAIVRLWKRD